jgi:L-fuconolactonase
MKRIDAHQHFWQVARRDYAWLTEDAFPALYRDFDPSDLAPLIERCGIDATVLVQGAETASETDFLLGIADATPFVAGVVGWGDLLAADAPARVERLAGRSKLVALRPMLEILADDEWILNPRLAPGIRAMEQCGLCFDALIRPRHLPVLNRFLANHPNLPVVIDHAAKPDIAGEEIEAWSRQIHEVAACSGAFVKLSGLATEAAPDWTADTLRPYAEALFDAFGPQRIMWGSDWPVLNVAGDYEGWHAAAQSLTAELSADDRDWVFGRTAARFYRLAERLPEHLPDGSSG